MFTGIIEAIGEVAAVTPAAGGKRIRVRMPTLAGDVAVGDSIAIDGACLTATRVEGGEVSFDAGEETLQVSTLGGFRPGRRVNLERALTPLSRLGGHFVQGHVDGIGRVLAITRRPGGWLGEFQATAEIVAQLVPKGSIAVDGVSLTLVDVAAAGFTVFLIPHTFANTTFGSKQPGEQVNLETDIIGRYVARFLGRAAGGGLTEEKLRYLGYA